MCELIKHINCTSTSVISNQFVFGNIQFKVTYFEALSEVVCCIQACVKISICAYKVTVLNITGLHWLLRFTSYLYQRKYFLLHTPWYFSFQKDQKRMYRGKMKGLCRNTVAL